jgi:putative signal transducing protein
MAYCPQCATEYEEGTRECMDCHVALQPGPPPPLSEGERDQGDVKLVTVRIFGGATGSTAAEVAKNLLESEGIPCLITGANVARMLNALDVHLRVREEDGERASRILEEYSEAAPPGDESA